VDWKIVRWAPASHSDCLIPSSAQVRLAGRFPHATGYWGWVLGSILYPVSLPVRFMLEMQCWSVFTITGNSLLESLICFKAHLINFGFNPF
jgi:hypothetical protein